MRSAAKSRVMRRAMVPAVVIALAGGLLTSCSPGPNPEAVEAAASYGEELGAWSAQLSEAAAGARTATTAEWTAAGEGELGFEEVGLGEILTEPPVLEQVEGAENTPTYLAAERVAEQVETVVTELSALEPEALETLRAAGFHSYWVVADLYYNTLGGPAAERRRADGEAAELAMSEGAQLKEIGDVFRAASLSFSEQRLELLGVAVEDMGGIALDEKTPVIPEDGLGVSVGAFIVDWLHEEEDFQKGAIEQLQSWEVASGAYNPYWNFGNLSSVFTAPLDHAATLRTAYVEQVAELAETISKTTSSSPAPTSAPSLPAVGEPYRQVLLDGYLPWGDPAQGSEYTANRLWMLWHIRELEGTADEPYTAARSALLETLNRGIEEGSGADFRPGSTRLLTFIQEYIDALMPDADVEANTWMLRELQELQEYGAQMRSYPMTAEVAADFDKVLALTEKLNADIEAAIEEHSDEFDQYDAIETLTDEFADVVTEAATPSLEALDDDAQAEELIAAAIEGTAPGASSDSKAEKAETAEKTERAEKSE